MLRDHLKDIVDHDPDFEWRGRNVTRIENLSDIVFALALGMLISSASPPVTYSELIYFLWSIIPVSAAFAILLVIWNAHFVYFRRYGLSDGTAVFYNAVLLLLVLFIAYPLRFMFDSFFAFIMAQTGDMTRVETMQLGMNDAAQMMAIYSVGYALIFLVMHRLYAHALRRADLLELSEKERLLTKASLYAFLMQIIVALIVAAVAGFTNAGPVAGFIYMLLWPAGWAIRRWFDKAEEPVAESS